mmetsp:Transcript_35625/g.93156  ORF Transcript_35625/g.93156 Transcript_35625/m.93156 type:complete len:230 (+) Transcript_35625:422-1111(+)
MCSNRRHASHCAATVHCTVFRRCRHIAQDRESCSPTTILRRRSHQATSTPHSLPSYRLRTVLHNGCLRANARLQTLAVGHRPTALQTKFCFCSNTRRTLAQSCYAIHQRRNHRLREENARDHGRGSPTTDLGTWLRRATSACRRHVSDCQPTAHRKPRRWQTQRQHAARVGFCWAEVQATLRIPAQNSSANTPFCGRPCHRHPAVEVARPQRRDRSHESCSNPVPCLLD